MGNKPLAVTFSVLLFIIVAVPALRVEGGGARDRDVSVRGVRDTDEGGEDVGMVVRREDRTPVSETEYGEISAVRVRDGAGGVYRLQFITLEPNALFLPVLLHSDMVLYVRTGNIMLHQ